MTSEWHKSYANWTDALEEMRNEAHGTYNHTKPKW